MTKPQAIRRARERAKRRNQEIHIVWSNEPDDPPGEHYHTATDDDLDGFYNGCTAVLTMQPDGTIEQ